jgi:DNA-directed RNA polymerase subunit F
MPDPLPLSDVKQKLSDEAAVRTLPREAMLAQQHAEGFARLEPAATAKLLADLRTLPFVDAALAVKLADIHPQWPEEIRLLFSKERVVLDETQLNRLLEILAQHR